MAKQRRRGGERERDEARGPGGPRYGGTAWRRADERAPDERYGHTRADNGDLAGIGAEDPAAAKPEEASFASARSAGAVSGGELVGIRRGDKPSKRRAPSRRRPHGVRAPDGPMPTSESRTSSRTRRRR